MRRRAIRHRIRLVGLMALAVLFASPVRSSRTLSWTESPEGLRRGEADGLAVSEDGLIFLAPEISRLGDGPPPGRPGQVWAMAADRGGNLYLGTGPDGHVLKIDSGGSQSIFFSVEEPMVTALATTSDGALLAGTAPGGRIYRIESDGKGALWSETGERYVWSLSVAGDGTVFAGTGERGIVFRIDRSGDAEPFFDGDEPHIVSVLTRSSGGVLAGGAGGGLVYEVDGDGNAAVRLDADLPEVVALAAEPGGAVLAALLAPPEAESPPPFVRIRLPDGTQVGTTDENVGSLEPRTGPFLRGTIEGLPEAAAGPERRIRGRLVRVEARGEFTEIWSSSREAPFCLSMDGQGGVLFGTGEPARLYGVKPGGKPALLATLVEAQVTGLLRVGRTVFLATSNPASAYRFEEQRAESGVFLSRAFDAGGPARWGSIRWESNGGVGRAELYTRTGNSENPDETWSAWSPALTSPRGSEIVNPDGRYLQWRVRIVASPGTGPRVRGVTVLYEPYNRSPQVRDFRVERPQGGSDGEAVFRWSSLDPDGDPVRLRLSYRSAASDDWIQVADAAPASAEGRAGEPSPGWTEGRRTWRTADLDEGEYEVRGWITDEAANDPGEGRPVEAGPPLRLIVDRSPPEVEIRSPSAGRFEVRARDLLSRVRRIQVLHEGVPRFTVRPVDGVCDSSDESFRFGIEGDPTGWSVRGADTAGNVTEKPLAGLR